MGLAKTETKKDYSQPRPASFIPSQGPAIGLPSPLGSVMSGQISGQKSGGRRRKDMSTPLLLTALVDAFSILVIFLLVQVTGVPNDFEAQDGLKLPQASAVDMNTDPSLKGVLNLVITKHGYVLNGKKLNLLDLKKQLVQAGRETKTSRLVIQADEKGDFDLLTPVLSLTAEAGISKLEFAVQAVSPSVGEGT
jgi:biopolymer transport protein ExbD